NDYYQKINNNYVHNFNAPYTNFAGPCLPSGPG
ncbi:unnamed protein product, partial [marine sediment metagenome]